MQALCLMLSMTHYAQNYADIIGGSLMVGFPKFGHNETTVHVHVNCSQLRSVAIYLVQVACSYNSK